MPPHKISLVPDRWSGSIGCLVVADRWPADLVRAAVTVAEESGELVKAVLDHEEKNYSKYAIVTEALQTAATAIRFLKNFNMEKENE